MHHHRKKSLHPTFPHFREEQIRPAQVCFRAVLHFGVQVCSYCLNRCHVSNYGQRRTHQAISREPAGYFESGSNTSSTQSSPSSSEGGMQIALPAQAGLLPVTFHQGNCVHSEIASSCEAGIFSEYLLPSVALRDSNKLHLQSVQVTAPATEKLEGFHGNNQHPPAT